MLFKAQTLRNHNHYLNAFFHDSRLKAALSFQDSYVGLNPADAPATFSIFSYSELTKGIWFPRGGMYQIVKALVAIAAKLPIKLVYNTGVSQIVLDHHRATGVVTEDQQQLNADVIVSNADLTYTYQHLLPESAIAKNLSKKQYSCSTLTYLWGMDKQYSKLKTHNLFLAPDYFNSFHEVVSKHKIPDCPHFYIHAPTRCDPNMAPVGEDTLTVIVPIGHLTDNSPQNWEVQKNKTREYIFKRLSGIGLPDLRDHIKFEMSATPPDWVEEYNLTYGSILGLHHNLLQMGYLRPHRQHSAYKNLYFVGSNTHPGSGVPTVLLSAQFTSQAILKQLGLRD